MNPAAKRWYEPASAMLQLRTLPPPPPPIAFVGSPTRELRRTGIDAAKELVRRRGTFHGWLANVLLDRHDLTKCGCGLIHCRAR